MVIHGSSDIDSEIEAKIRGWEQALLPDEQVIVEGGHFTIQALTLSLPTVAIPKQDTVYLLDLKPGSPDPPYQMFRTSGSRGSDLSIVDPPGPEILDLRDWPGLTAARELRFHPTPTEERSFRHAVAAVRRLRERVARAVPALFIGDIGHGLPAAMKQFLQSGNLLPDSYRAELEDQGLAGDLCLFLESSCRNRGKEWVLDRSKAESEEEKEGIYRKWGYVIFSLRNIYSLAGDSLISQERFPLIPLTKSEQNTPTCALILAGKYLKMAREGFTQVLAIYDKRDDPEIRVKNREGIMIASCLLGDHPLKFTLVTVDDWSPREPVMVDRVIARHINAPGAFTSYQDLVTAVRNRALQDGAAAEQCSQDTCSVQRHRQA